LIHEAQIGAVLRRCGENREIIGWEFDRGRSLSGPSFSAQPLAISADCACSTCFNREHTGGNIQPERFKSSRNVLSTESHFATATTSDKSQGKSAATEEINMNIHELCDYILVKASEAGMALNLLKLQKLVYYAEAWFQAFYDRPLTGGAFQAWVHGPVSRALYDRFRDDRSLYSAVDEMDVRPTFDLNAIDLDERRHVDAVLEVYGSFTGSQLEEMTHNEEPWLQARGDRRPSERCEAVIDPVIMGRYYRSRIPTSQTA
jgi:uncharacterized phage-associated protein